MHLSVFSCALVELPCLNGYISLFSGYMAPEYLMRGNYSVKSDAFSFSVMVLEIVTGRKNNDSYYNSQKSGELLTTVSAN